MTKPLQIGLLSITILVGIVSWARTQDANTMSGSNQSATELGQTPIVDAGSDSSTLPKSDSLRFRDIIPWIIAVLAIAGGLYPYWRTRRRVILEERAKQEYQSRNNELNSQDALGL